MNYLRRVRSILVCVFLHPGNVTCSIADDGKITCTHKRRGQISSLLECVFSHPLKDHCHIDKDGSINCHH